MFGSARTLPTDPLYAQARDLAALLAAHGWSTVTGAGPGIMAAGLEGAGPDHAFGINIRLPFEQGANEFIAENPKLVSMKYFFTRKLLLIKESFGYAVLPGGFGTLDEAFELLTLIQTGKAEPAPVVLLDLPGSSYWKGWERFVTEEVATRGLISADDISLYRIVDRVEDAAAEILGFYRNYHSLRWVGDTLVIRLEAAAHATTRWPSCRTRFADALHRPIRILDAPLPAERRSEDFPDLARVALRFDRVSYARLRELIDALNTLPSAPPAAAHRSRPREARDPVPVADRPVAIGGRDGPVPGGVRPARDQPGPGPGHRSPPRRLLRPPGRGRRRCDRHRDGLGHRRRLALRAGPAGRRVRRRLAGRRRGLPAARHAGAGRARPRRRAGVQRLLAVGACGRRPGSPTWCPASCPPRSIRPGSTTVVAGFAEAARAGDRPAAGRGRGRRRGLVAAAPVPLRAHQPAPRRLRRGPAAAHPRGAGRRPPRHRPRPRSWPCGCPATSWRRGPGSPPSRPPSASRPWPPSLDLLTVVRAGPFSTAAYRPTPTPRRPPTSSCAGPCGTPPAAGARGPAGQRRRSRRRRQGPRRRRRRPGRDDPGPDRRRPPGRPACGPVTPSGPGPACCATRPARSATTATRS